MAVLFKTGSLQLYYYSVKMQEEVVSTEAGDLTLNEVDLWNRFHFLFRNIVFLGSLAPKFCKLSFSLLFLVAPYCYPRVPFNGTGLTRVSCQTLTLAALRRLYLHVDHTMAQHPLESHHFTDLQPLIRSFKSEDL